MKRLATILNPSLLILPFAISAAVPLKWTVETSRMQPVQFDAVRGETLALEAAFNSYGTPLELPENAALFYQTNGMGAAWWTIPATVSSNRIAAVFAPTNDPGAAAATCFLGSSGDVYRAAFTLRFRNGPGATPNVLPIPKANYNIALAGEPTINGTNLTAFVADMAESDPHAPGIVSNIVTKSYVEDLGISGGGSVPDNVVRTNASGRAGIVSAMITGGEDFPEFTEGDFNVRGSSVLYGDVTIKGNVSKHCDSTGGSFSFIDYAASFGSIELPTERGITLGRWNVEDWFNSKADTNAVATAIANAGHLTQSAADAAYYPKAQGQAWSTYWDGDDVRVTVTNYDSDANIPSLYLEQRTNETAQATNAFRTVWRETAHWERFLGTNWNWSAAWSGFRSWADGVSSEIAEKADRAWGYCDSHTGAYAPDGYTVISSSNVMFAANMSYQKTVTGSAAVWVLTANEPYEATGVATNGSFQIRDADGNVQFEIVRGDKVTAPAQANSAAVTNGTLYVTYGIIAATHPTAEICLDLGSANWKAETDDDCPATVVWSGESGAYVAAITPNQTTARCFCKATYRRGGDTYVNHRCAVGMSQLVLGGVTYDLGTNTIGGSLVLTLTPAN